MMLENTAANSLSDTSAAVGLGDKLRDYYDLAKPGIGFYAVISAFAAYWLGSPSPVHLQHLFWTLLATSFVTAGGGALNQLLEIDEDRLMKRTANRPLPSGRVSLQSAMVFGAGFSVAGLLLMQFTVGPLATLLSVATLVGYLFIYTPLKKKSHLSTVVGAFPGAIPILIGWVAATGSINLQGWTLFAILFLWQIPHFLAIAWMYRKDYARAGFPMLSVIDADGNRVGQQVLLWVALLLPVSLFPTVLGMTGLIYFIGAFALGVGFIGAGIYSSMRTSNTASRRLLFASIIYLPILLLLMVVDKT